jgi:hypothetical protein
MARWIGEQAWGEEAVPVREMGLRLGNSSNAALQQVLSTTLLQALELLRSGEPWVVDLAARAAGTPGDAPLQRDALVPSCLPHRHGNHSRCPGMPDPPGLLPFGRQGH